MIGRIKDRLKPKGHFHALIKEQYVERAQDRIPKELLDTIITRVTEDIYRGYRRFWKKYPKSRKRYATLKIEDIDHPYIHFLIIDLLNYKSSTERRTFSKILFRMDDHAYDQLVDYKA